MRSLVAMFRGHRLAVTAAASAIDKREHPGLLGGRGKVLPAARGSNCLWFAHEAARTD